MASIGYKITADNKELLKTFNLTGNEIDSLSGDMTLLGKTIDKVLIESANSLREFGNQILNNKELIRGSMGDYERMLPDLERVKNPNVTDGGEEYIALKNAINETVGALIGYEEENRKLQTEYDRLSASQKELIDLNEKIKASSGSPFAGMESALSGVSGAFSAAQGVMSLFGKSNEHLADIQTKLQSAMSVTVGLQKICNTLQETSTFRITTMAKVTQLWDNSVKLLNTQLGISVGLSKALLTGGIGLLIAGITAIIITYDKWKKKQEEINNLQTEFKNIEIDVAKSMADQQIQVKTLMSVANDQNKNLKIRNEAIRQLNNLMPDYNGYIDKEGNLVANTEEALKAYLVTLYKVEKAKKIFADITQQQEQLNELKVKGPDDVSWLDKLAYGFVSMFDQNTAEDGLNMAIKNRSIELEKELDRRNKNITAKNIELDDLLKDTSVFESLFGQSVNNTVIVDKAKDIQSELIHLQQQIEQGRIELMEEGAEKRLAQINLDYEKEIAAIEEQEAKWRNTQKGTLVPEQVIWSDTMYQQTFDKRIKAEEKVYAESDKKREEHVGKEKQSWINYNKQYGDYQAKRLAITEDYALKIANAQTDGEKASLAKDSEKAIHELDKSMLEQSDLWKNLFTDASKQTNTFIKKIIDDTQKLVDFINGKEGAVLPSNINEEWAKGLNKKDAEALLDALIKKSDVLQKQNPFGQIINGFKLLAKVSEDTGEKMDEATESETRKKAFGLIAQGAQNASAIIGTLGNTVKSFFGESAQGEIENITKSIQGLMGVGGGAAKLIGGDPSGIVEILQGVPSLIDGITGLFGGNDDAKLLKQIEKYEGLISLYDKLIDKQKEYLSTLTGGDAVKQAEETEQLIERRQEAERKKLEAWLKTGASGNHHSMGYRLGRDLGTELGITKGNKGKELFSYTVDQWEALQRNIELWEKLPKEVRAYGEAVMQGKADTEALGETLRETLTGNSFSELQNGLLELVSTAEMAFGDIEKSFGDHMKKAIQQGIKTKYLTEGLKDWEKAFAKAMDDDILSNDEANQLRESYTRIATQANEDYINRMKAAGLEGMLEGEGGQGKEGGEETKASSRTLQGVTQDTASELLGQARALRMDIAEGLEYLRTKDNGLAGMTGVLSDLQTNTFNIQGLVQSQLTSIVQIERNTFNTVNRLDQIIDNGVKIKEGKE